jgi:hypothetical protein
MESCDHHCMLGRYAAVLIAIIMALVKTISVIAQSQNETNEMDIGEMCYYSPPRVLSRTSILYRLD